MAELGGLLEALDVLQPAPRHEQHGGVVVGVQEEVRRRPALEQLRAQHKRAQHKCCSVARRLGGAARSSARGQGKACALALAGGVACADASQAGAAALCAQ